MEKQQCRECGCTDDHACALVQRTGVAPGDAAIIATCSWAEGDLCSACAEEGLIWVRPDAQVYARERVQAARSAFFVSAGG